jgi:thiamine-monophosphate kinase
VTSSEFDLIAAIAERLPEAGPRVRVPSGDDAAVVETQPASAVTVDAIVDGVHFELGPFSPEAVGRKALAAGLSDLAAMGADPGEAYVVVGAPADATDELLLGIADGLAETAGREGVSIAGGDLVGAPALFVSVTAVGYEGDTALVTRSGARPGDVVVVTGELGGAAAALELLGSDAAAALPAEVRGPLLARQLDPRPLFAAGLALASSGATAMIDLSDGLGADAGHVASGSGCRLEIDLDRVPVAAGVEAVAGGEGAALELAVSGGEDYELLATLPPERLETAHRAVADGGAALAEIGYAVEGSGVALKLPGGGELEPRGFDHRRGSRSGSAGSASGTPGSAGPSAG